MPNFNPFSSNDEDTSFERGTPAGQVVKTVTKAVSDQTKIQTKAFQDDLNALLFGPSTPPDQDGASKDIFYFFPKIACHFCRRDDRARATKIIFNFQYCKLIEN